MIELRDAIEQEDRIIQDAVVDAEGCVCTLGALYVHREMEQGLSREDAVEKLRGLTTELHMSVEEGGQVGADPFDMEVFARHLGVDDHIAQEIIYETDERPGTQLKEQMVRWTASVLDGTAARFSERAE